MLAQVTRHPLVIERSIRSYIFSQNGSVHCLRQYATKNTTDNERATQKKRSLAKTLGKLRKQHRRLKATKELVDCVQNNEEPTWKHDWKAIIRDVNKAKKQEKAVNAKSGNTSKRAKPKWSDSVKEREWQTPRLPAAQSGLKKGFKDATWTDDWGKDVLVPHEWKIGDAAPINNNPLHSKYGYIRHLAKDNVLKDIPSTSCLHEVATLGKGLERVLFNPGSVHWLQDPRSGIYNFDKRYQTIPDVTKFDFGRLGRFIQSSRDDDLHALALKFKRPFTGSTSSLSGLLCQLYFLISEERNVDTSVLSKQFQSMTSKFTPAQRMPASVIFRYRNGVHAIDSDGGDGDYHKFSVLMWQGTMLEKLLTYPENKFAEFLSEENTGGTTVEQKKEAFRYSMSNSFVMRSQLDGRDPRLPGTGVFDIKTRAALPLRLDVLNYREHAGYHILHTHGLYSSFEREYYDMIRAAFLKYQFQVRIGNMDGIFVAYHNTARIYGFQYLPLEEMDARLFGESGDRKGTVAARAKGDRVFYQCVRLLEVLCREIAECYPQMSVTCTVHTVGKGQTLRAWVQPAGGFPVVSTKPSIIEINFSINSFLNEERASGPRAMDEIAKPWIIRYEISRSTDSESNIRKRFEEAKRHQQFDYYLPAGISFEQLQSYWEELGWDDSVGDGTKGGRLTMENVKAERFKRADVWIEMLRNISREGLLRDAIKSKRSSR